MNWKTFFGFLFFIFVVGLLVFYEFFPLVNDQFQMSTPANTGFNVGNYNPDNMQFYPNMRFPDRQISYYINPSCNLEKKAEMQNAFEIISNLTSLTFYPVEGSEEISVACSEKDIIDQKGLYIAGEGGPTEIVKTKNFNIIFSGKILLLKNSDCGTPNIATHELLHVLGFQHSENPGSIMYPVTRCNQVIGEDIIRRIDELYSFESYPDLSVDNATAIVHGRYVDINMSVSNDGLADLENANVSIYTDGKLLKEFSLGIIKVGYGKTISFGNLYSSERTISQIKILAETSQPEIDKSNNEVILNVVQ